VAVRLTDKLVASKVKPDDTFAITLAAPLIVEGQVVLPAGTPARRAWGGWYSPPARVSAARAPSWSSQPTI
jgi:hypothetical protein